MPLAQAAREKWVKAIQLKFCSYPQLQQKGSARPLCDLRF
jgi:hypothetical protein